MRTPFSSTVVLCTGGLLLAALFSTLPLPAQQRAGQSAEKSARVIERGAHHAKWETVRDAVDPLTGETNSVISSYIQLETGLHFQNEQGEWTPASERIEVIPGYAVAKESRHQVRWAANLNTYGAVEFWTPEGELARSHVLGLAYFDPKTRASVMIAEIQDSVGSVAGNEVIYEDAFDAVDGAIRYRFTKHSFEQDVIIRAKLPDPALWGFDPATVQLQVLTEFVALPEAATAQTRDELLSAGGVDPAVVRGTVEELEDFLRDAEVSFGEMRMTRGRAFRLNDGARESAVEVRKKLETFEGGRRILVETVEVRDVAPLLEELPELSKPTASLTPSIRPRQQAAVRVAPAAPARQTAGARLMDDRRAQQLALNTLQDTPRGLVIDYTLTGSTNNLTLQSDTQYFVTGPVTVTGVLTIEGAVVKFANTNGAQLKVQGIVNCRTAPFRPAIFTSAHDDNIGVAISYTNAATAYYATNALWIDSNVSDLRHLHIRHAWRGIYLAAGASNSHLLTHVQLLNCREGLVTAGPTFRLRNALFNQVLTNFHSTASATGHVEHLTANGASILKGTTSLTLNVTNSLLVQITNASTINSGAGNATYAASGGVFQTVGVGEHYLAAGSTNRNAGVTNLSLQLQLDFKEMTTYPPPNVYSNVVVTTNMVWTRDATIRDGDTPDRGYHYTAADYATYALKLDGSVLTLTNGVAVLGIDSPYFWPYNGGRIVSTGAPERMNTLGDYQAVQEGTNLWAFPFYPAFHYTIYARVPFGQSQAGASEFRFTRVPSIADNRLVSVMSAFGALDSMDGFTLRDSEVWRATISQVNISIPLSLTNNLLHRSTVYQDYSAPTYPNIFVNNTFIGGSLTNTSSGAQWVFRNNLFDRPAISFGADPVHSHNGYVTGFPQLPGGSSGNVVLTNNVAYEPGPYGDFYLGDVILANATAALRNAGNTNAGALGLYHFTTHVDQVKETNSVVDLGYHYVAVSKADAFAASGGFSGTQGANQWYYQQGSLLGTPAGSLTFDGSMQRWNLAADYYTIVARIHQHTGDNHDSFRTFQAPRPGTVLVLSSITDGNNGCGNDDGVRVRALLNSAEVMPWTHVPRYTTNSLLALPLKVTTGDQLQFQVNKNGNKDCDATVWNPVIVYLDENGLVPPEDTDADGLPDHLEDANGNGSLDGGESAFADDDPDIDGLPTWWERTYGFPATVAAEPVRWLNFTNHVIQNYDLSQDINTDAYAIEDGGWQLKLWGNNWKVAPFNLTTTTNTRARMLYRSYRRTGEIQGFGLDNDKVYNNGTVVLYKLAGSQNDFGNLTHDNYWASGKRWQLYSLPVGAAYPGSYTYAVFANDNDANVDTFVCFRHVSFGPDSDGDGAFDQDEYLAGTDPFNSDTDGDGVVDGWEAYYAGWDIDDDGVTTAQELLDGTDPGNPDSDYDGRSDGEEKADGTNPLNPASVADVRLGYWSFDEDFLSDTGAAPFWVIGPPPLVTSPFGKGVNINAPDYQTRLLYPLHNPDGSANFNLRRGTVRFQFKPDWNSTNAGGSGPGPWGRLWNVGEYTALPTITNGFWEVGLNPAGTDLGWAIQTNDYHQQNRSSTVSWTSNAWYQVAVTYDLQTVKIYTNGTLAANGRLAFNPAYSTTNAGVVFWPHLDRQELRGFSLGTDGAGAQGSKGTFDELEAFNYPLSAERIAQEHSRKLIPAGSNWKYLDDGSNQGTAWSYDGFNDSGWSSGAALFGYGDVGATIVTTNSYGGNPNDKHITYYFRKEFVVYGADQYPMFPVRYIRDDGIVIHVNGIEAHRDNLPAGAVDSETRAVTAIGGTGEHRWNYVNLDPWLFMEGTNLIAVELHQSGPASSDISFDLELVGNIHGPQVEWVAPTNNTSLVAGGNLELSARAWDDSGIRKVVFYANGVRVGEAAEPDGNGLHTFNWESVPAGSHLLAAKAIDYGGLTATSTETVNLTVAGHTLFVVASTTLNAAETAVSNRLVSLGYSVTTKTGTGVTSADANGKTFVLISSTISSVNVNTKFRDSTTPVVSWEEALQDDFGMTTASASDYGTASGQTQLVMTGAGHPLSAGLSGTVTVVTNSSIFTWGKPNSNAVRIATLSGDTNKVAIYGYEMGASMPGQIAPARRVEFFLDETTAASLNPNGWALFDAAVTWAATPPCFPAVDVAVVFDRSSSMNGQPLIDARNAATQFIQRLDLAEDQAAIISFATNVLQHVTLTNDLSVLVAAINSVTNNTGSRIDLGIDAAQAELESARHNPAAAPVMILFSDGKPASGSSNQDVLDAADAARANGTRLIVVGYGDVNESLLLQVASTSQDYFYAPDSGDFDDVLAAIAASICRAGGAQPPVVDLSPADGKLFIAGPTNVVLTAVLNNFTNPITKVEFFTNSVALGEVLSPPYQLVWENAPPGVHTLQAKVHVSGGPAVFSDLHQITVNALPSVTITAPANEASFVEVTNLVVTATATDSDGTVNEVRFYRGADPVAFATNNTPSGSTFQITWTGRTNASYAIRARAFDNRGAAADSEIRVFTVNPTNQYPVVTLTSPADGASFKAGQQIVITATATDSDGIKLVEFFNGTNRLGSDSFAPYSFTIPCAAEGTYQLVARATDNANYRASSAIHSVTVGAPVLLSAEGYWDPGFMPTNTLVAGLIPYHDFAEDAGGNLVGVGDLADHYNMARWGSCVWSLVASNAVVNNVLRSVEPYGGGLVVGGDFASSLKYVAWWDGSSFHPLGSNVIDQATGNGVYDVRVINGNVFIGGQFGGIGGNTSIQHIAQLAGTNWVQVGNGLNGKVRALALMNGNLHVGGEFTTAGGNTNIQYLARLDGSNWAAVGTGVNGPVHTLASCGASLYVGGSFASAGGDTNANGIAIWDGERWGTIAHGVGEGYHDGTGATTNIVESIVVRGNELFVGGEFTKAYGLANTNVVNYVARALFNDETGTWDWHSLKGGVMEDHSEENKKLTHVHGLYLREHSSSDGYELIVGGRFRKAGYTNVLETPSFNVARWVVGESDCLPQNLPTVSITAPVNGARYTNSVSSLPIVASASANGGNSVFQVDFYINGSLLGTDNGSPYSVNWSSSIPDLYELTARVTDSAGQVAVSAPTYVTIIDHPDAQYRASNDEFVVFANSGPNLLEVTTNDVALVTIPTITAIKPFEYFVAFDPVLPRVGGTAVISAESTNIWYTPRPNAFGTDQFLYELVGGGTSVQRAIVTVHVRAKPEVAITSPADGWVTNLSATVPIIASSFDPDGSVTNLILRVNGNQLASYTTAAFTNHWSTNAHGFYIFTVEAKDNHGYSTISEPVTVTIPGNSTPPVALLSNLVNTNTTVNGRLDVLSYPTIRDGLFDLHGSAYDVDSASAYQVLLYRPDDQETPFANITPGALNAQGFREVEVTAASLGILDLTTVPNGIYLLELRVRGGGQEAVDAAYVSIDSQLKLGQFSFSEQDLVIPVNGFPLTVIRTYNSQKHIQGDFGWNWTYALNDLDVVLDEERSPRPAFESLDADTPADSSIPYVDLRLGGGRNVTLTLPGGERATFVFTPKADAENQRALARWTPAPGVTARLEILGNEVINYFPWLHWQASGPQTPFDQYDIPGFALTTLDGTRYEMERAPSPGLYAVENPDVPNTYIYVAPQPGEMTLRRIVQRTGDKIELSLTNIQHRLTNGTLTRSVTFERDGAGRITAIRDPLAGVSGYPAVKYFYGGASGNLQEVHKLVDRATGAYLTNKYFYHDTKHPHYLTSMEDARGIQVARQLYDDTGKLVGIVDAAGRTNSFIHDIAGKREIFVDQLGYGTTNHYDARGNVSAIVDALGRTNRFAHDENNRVTVTIDPLGNTNLFGYDENGLRSAITNALGQVTRIDFDGLGQLLSKTDALTNTTFFEYNSIGRRTAVEDALGNRTKFAHDAFGRPTAVTNALNQLRATAASDSLGELLYVSWPGGLKMDFARNANGSMINKSFAWVNPDNTNQVEDLYTHTEFDAANRITRTIDPDGKDRRTIYDNGGRVAQSIDRMGTTNSFAYDVRGNVIQTTHPDGTISRSIYDARSQLEYASDRYAPGASTRGTRFVYDSVGRLVRTERLASLQINVVQVGAASAATLGTTGAVLSAYSTAYDAANRVRFSTNGLGHTTEYQYDAAGRQTALIDALASRTDQVYDAAGRLTYITNALQQVTRFDYDKKGRRIKTVFPDNSFVTNGFNAIGQLVAVTDQSSLTTDNEFDGLGRLNAILRPLVSDPEGGTNARPRFEYGYDSYGNIRVVRDAKGRETKFTYDKLGQLLSRKLPLLQTETSVYNGLGQVTDKVDFRGQTNRFIYDSLGRVATNLLYAAGASTPGQTNIFEYQADGKLFRITRPEGTTTFAYNADGAVTNLVSPEGALNYEHHAVAGYLTRVYTSKTDLQYAYDELGRLKTVTLAKRNGVTLGTPEVTTNTYTALGQIKDVYFPNGTRSFHQYSLMNYLTNLVHYGPTNQVLSRHSYTAASDGRRLTATEVRLESGGGYVTNQLSWDYDSQLRLTRERSVSTIAALNFTNSYVYSLTGNRLWKTNLTSAGANVTTYTYNANDQLLTEAATVGGTFTNLYDANGALTNRCSGAETNWFAYNLEGRLATAIVRRTESGSFVEQTNKFFYNHAGLRVRTEIARRVNGGAVTTLTNVFLNDGLNPSGFSQVLEELPEVGATPVVTYTLGHRVLAQEKGGTVSHLLADGHGSTRLLTGTTGAISHRYTHDAYGLPLDFTPGALTPPQTAMLYAGEQYDPGVRQYYLRARYYQPAVGRFDRMDAFGGVTTDPQSLHRYTYAHNDPVNYRDPSGNFSLVETSLASGIAAELQREYLKTVAKHGYVASKKVTELGQSRDSILDGAARLATPGVASAAIIVHGVTHKGSGWSSSEDIPFQQNLTGDSGRTARGDIAGDPLTHDFYEYNWGGFSIGGFGLIPIKSVHQMALVHLEMTQFLVMMNGYENIDLISHSWGTVLAYDLQNVSGIPNRHWVTMGSPLKATTPKPAGNTGLWINCLDPNDKVTGFEAYPPFPDVMGLPLPSFGPGLRENRNVDIPREYDFRAEYNEGWWVHGGYWISPRTATDLRRLLQ